MMLQCNILDNFINGVDLDDYFVFIISQEASLRRVLWPKEFIWIKLLNMFSSKLVSTVCVMLISFNFNFLCIFKFLWNFLIIFPMYSQSTIKVTVDIASYELISEPVISVIMNDAQSPESVDVWGWKVRSSIISPLGLLTVLDFLIRQNKGRTKDLTYLLLERSLFVRDHY